MNTVIKELFDRKFSKKYRILKELTDHGDSQVYLINAIRSKTRFILRIGKIGESDLSLKNNIIALKILKKENNIPDLIEFGKFKGCFYSIESFLSGRKQKESIVGLKKMLNSIRKINAHKSNKCGWLSTPQTNWRRYFLNNCVNNYRERLSKKIKDYDKYLNYANENIPDEKVFHLLHGDFSFTNCLFNKSKVGFFDFEGSFYGPKEYDLSMIYFMELLPKIDLIDYLRFKKYNFKNVLYYALCIGIRKVALSKNKRHAKRRLEKLEKIYSHIQKQ